VRRQAIAQAQGQVIDQGDIANMVTAALVKSVRFERITAVGHEDQHPPAGTQHAHHLAQSGRVIPHVFQHFMAEDQIKAIIGKRQLFSGRAQDVRGARMRLPSACEIVFEAGHRPIGVLLSGISSGMAGGFMALCLLGIFRDNIVSGRGFIALAIVIFGRWNPYKAALAALIFGGADALQLSLQIFNPNIPSQALVSLPYVLTILAMSGLLGKAISPAALMNPYKKE
jgi:hypothetical protein